MRTLPRKISFMFEIAERCNQRCAFCYNAWRPEGAPSRKELATDQVLRILARILEEIPCDSVAFSGGEPLLRQDLFDIISYTKERGTKVSLITNGALLDKQTIQRALASGVDVFQVTLLSDRPDVHNHLVGVSGFERVLEAVLETKKAGGRINLFFVATAENIGRVRGVLELCVLLGVDSFTLGRFLPGGVGLAGWEKLLPSPDMIDRALETAEEFAQSYRLPVLVSNPIPPCLHDYSKYKTLKFGFCGVGNREHAFFAIDPEGNLKVCSHSPVALGNLLEKRFAEIVENSFYADFEAAVPEFCRDCPELPKCRGGCRSSAHACYGSLGYEDPYLATWKSRARKPAACATESPYIGCDEVP